MVSWVLFLSRKIPMLIEIVKVDVQLAKKKKKKRNRNSLKKKNQNQTKKTNKKNTTRKHFQRKKAWTNVQILTHLDAHACKHTHSYSQVTALYLILISNEKKGALFRGQALFTQNAFFRCGLAFL